LSLSRLIESLGLTYDWLEKPNVKRRPQDGKCFSSWAKVKPQERWKIYIFIGRRGFGWRESFQNSNQKFSTIFAVQ